MDVYVLGTGISIGRTEFEGRASWGATMVEGSTAENEDGTGTHLAGIVASRQYGVAKKASVIAVKVSSGSEGDAKSVLKGLTWTMGRAEATGRPSVALITCCPRTSAELNEQINAAAEQGVFVVVPAGDDGCSADREQTLATAPRSIVVSASTFGDERAPSSNYGKQVSVCAPGDQIPSTSIGSPDAVATRSGTEQAAAHVAGLAAYLLSTVPGLTTSTVGDAITGLASKDILSGLPEGTLNLLAFNDASES